MWPARNLASVFGIISYVLSMDLESVVGTAARYGLDGPGIESRWGAIFSTSVQTCPGDHPASCVMSKGLFWWVKRPERGIDHPLWHRG